MKGKLGKFGFVLLALALCLSITGAAFAAWTDDVTISGTVNTGSVGITAVYFSGTDIYKDLDTDAMVSVFWVKDAAGKIMWQSGTAPTNNTLVASAAAAPGATDDTVNITYDNAFPTADLVADVIIHCDGSIPVIVTADIDSASPWLVELWNKGNAGFYAARVNITPSPWAFSVGDKITGPIQMHYCEYAKVWLYLDLPQNETLMGLDGTFTAHINAIQWNEYLD